MSDDDGILGDAPAPQGEGVADGDLSDTLEPGVEGPVAARRRNREAPRRGGFACFLVSDDSLPCPACGSADGPLPDASTPPRRCVVGVGSCEWRFVEPSAEVVAMNAEVAPTVAKRGRCRAPWGFLEYHVMQGWALDEPVNALAMDLGAIDVEIQLRRRCGGVSVSPGGAEVRRLLVQKFTGQTLQVLVLHPALIARAWQRDALTLVRSVPLLLRNTFDGIVDGHPKTSLVSRWRKALDVARLAQVPVMEDVMDDRRANIELELPAARAAAAHVDQGNVKRGPLALHAEVDPLRMDDSRGTIMVA